MDVITHPCPNPMLVSLIFICERVFCMLHMFLSNLCVCICLILMSSRTVAPGTVCLLTGPSFDKFTSLLWRHNGHDGVSNHQPHDCLLRRRSKKASKIHVTGLCAGNSPVTGEFPAQMASNAENVSIWWRHRVYFTCWRWWIDATLISSICVH